MSVHDIGASCGVSGPALYRHFASKDAMLAEMLVSISERLLSEARSRVAVAPDDETALRELVRWHTDFALTHKDLIVVQDRDWGSLPDAARERVRTLQRSYVGLWVAALRRVRTDVGPRDGEAVAHAVFGLLNSTPHSARLSVERMRALLETMAWEALPGRVIPSHLAHGRGRTYAVPATRRVRFGGG